MTEAKEATGKIEPDVVYTLQRAMMEMNWGRAAFRTARRRGLRVKYAGRTGYVMGRDLIDYIDRAGRDTK